MAAGADRMAVEQKDSCSFFQKTVAGCFFKSTKTTVDEHDV